MQNPAYTKRIPRQASSTSLGIQIVHHSPRTHDCNLLLTPPQRPIYSQLQQDVFQSHFSSVCFPHPLSSLTRTIITSTRGCSNIIKGRKWEVKWVVDWFPFNLTEKAGRSFRKLFRRTPQNSSWLLMDVRRYVFFMNQEAKIEKTVWFNSHGNIP